MSDLTPETVAELRRLYEVAFAVAAPENDWEEWTSRAAEAFPALLDAAAERDALAAELLACKAVPALLDAAADRDALAAKVERVRALASGMGMPRPGADADRDSALTRMKLRSAGHRILRALDGGES